ncbi:hypothetical protein VTO73DRAFT_14892 [Trametes versicolor]
MDGTIYSPADELPPPAYEITQDDFDQKTGRVIEESAREPPEPRVDEDGFEIWDEDAFEAALAAMGSVSVVEGTSSGKSSSGSDSLPNCPPEKAHKLPEQPNPQAASPPVASGSSSAGSSSSQVRPLTLTKKTRPGKERPSWFQEAGLGAPTPSAPHAQPPSRADVPSQTEALSRAGRPPRRQLTVMNRDGADLEREVTPPPEFTPVGPSLDGPPYESFTMSYDGPELEPPDHLPPPPAFDTLPERYTPRPSPQPSPQPDRTRPHPAHAQSLPATALSPLPTIRPHVDHAQTLPAARVPPPPATNALKDYQPRAKFPGAPRLAFNPQLAYSKPLPSVPQDEEPPPQTFDASAFYNGAVAAHFSSNIPARMRKPSAVQSDRSSIYSQDSSWAPPTNGYGSYGSPPSQAVVSPRPSYAYQAAFPDAAPSSNGAWNPGGRTQQWG